MSPPLHIVSLQGLGVVPADLLNTYEQVFTNLADLRGFTPITGMGAFVQGFNTPGDGGAGSFWWNANAVSANYTDDNANTIIPNGAIVGVWLRLGYFSPVVPYLYSVPLTGFSITLPTGVGALILNPAGTLATGSIILASPQRDGWPVRISCSQIITSVSVSATGATVSGAPTAFTAGQAYGFLYVTAANTWFRA